MAKKKISLKIRQQVLSLFHQGYGSDAVANRTELSKSTVANWLILFRQGNLLWSTMKRSSYAEIPIKIKQAAVEEYISGKGGYRTITAKFKIHRTSNLVRWVKNYTNFGSISLEYGRSSKKRPICKDQQLMKPNKNDQPKSEKEINEDQKIRIAFLENLMKVREEEESDFKKKAHLKRLREQYEAAFPSQEP